MLAATLFVATLLAMAFMPVDAKAQAQGSDIMRDLPRGHYLLPETGSVIGQDESVVIEKGDTLVDLARQHNVGYEAIRMANPEVSIWAPLPGTEVMIPKRHILPEAPREGIVVNLSELRLYYYSADNIVETYPISVGRDGFGTPVGETRTTVKVKDPHWSPPRSMREEAAARGEPPPTVVPPGPENPLGRHAILLGLPSYLIHGTNRPEGVGMRVSRGCIRMYPEDIKSLFERVPSGTPVNIIDQPFKAGWSQDGVLYAQSFPQLEENQASFEPLINALGVVSTAFGEAEPPVDYAKVRRLVEAPDGAIVSLLRSAEEDALPRKDRPDTLYDFLEATVHQGEDFEGA
nr:L,D-transpeptidase family protein [Halomonas korlensis]